MTTTETAAPAKTHSHPNYFMIFIILAVITGVMTAVELLHLDITRSLRNTIFLMLSIIKAVLVAMYYMHLKMDSRLYTGLFALPVFLVMVLVIILII
jgi:cytochrome c oxidase subunit 4